MQCLRCGYCCVAYDVIVMIEVLTPKGRKTLKACHKPSSIRCPRLEGPDERGQFSCKVHDRKEYKSSPCYAYGNPEIDPDYAGSEDSPCRIGAHLSAKGGLIKARPMPEAADPGSLEVLGRWSA
jgi:hypothetical protein